MTFVVPVYWEKVTELKQSNIYFQYKDKYKDKMPQKVDQISSESVH